MKSTLLNAKFKGICRICGKRIRVGDQVWYSKNHGLRCTTCGHHQSTDSRISKWDVKRPTSRPEAKRPEPTPAPRAEIDSTPVNTAATATGSDGVHRLEWAGVGDVIRDAFGDFGQGGNREFLNKYHQSMSGGTWANSHTKQSLTAALSNPSEKILAAVDAIRQTIDREIDLPQRPRRRVRHGLDMGDELDVDRWSQRIPEAWDRSMTDPVERRTVTIGINLSVNCAQKPSELLYRGAALVALAERLTAQGVNVRIIGFASSTNFTDLVARSVYQVELKSSGHPMDIGAVCTAACDVGFYRMAMLFGYGRHLPGKVTPALGYPTGLPTADRKGIDHLIEFDVRNAEQAVAWVKAQLSIHNQSTAA